MTADGKSRSRFKLGDLVRDGALTGKIVVDLDSGTALAPHTAATWMERHERGVMIETAGLGVVHCADPARLKPSETGTARGGLFVLLLLGAIAAWMFFSSLLDPWNGRRMGEGWACNGMPPSGQVCAKNVPTPAPPKPAAPPAPG